MKRFKPLFTVLLVLALVTVPAAAISLEAGTGDDFYVQDNVGVLSAETQELIVGYNEILEAQCNDAQLVVVTVSYLEDDDTEVASAQLMSNWGVGSADESNGMLLLLVSNEYRGWLATGDGIDEIFTDELAEEYLNDYFWDYIDNNQFDEGVQSLAEKLYDWYLTYYDVEDTVVNTETNTSVLVEDNDSSSVLENNNVNYENERRNKFMGGYIVIIAIIAIIIYFSKSHKKKSSDDVTDEPLNEVDRLLLNSPYYETYKTPFDLIRYRNQPKYKVEWLLQSLDMGHKIEDNGYYIMESIKNGLPYFMETEDEYDAAYERGCGARIPGELSACKGNVEQMFEMCSFYNQYNEKQSHPAKQKFWQDQLLQRAESGNLLAQGVLCENMADSAFSPGAAEMFQGKYKNALLEKAEAGVALAQLAVGKHIAPYKSPERIEWLTKAGEQGLSDAWSELGQIYFYMITDGKKHQLPKEEEAKLEKKRIECQVRAAEADNGMTAGYNQEKVAEYYEFGEQGFPKDLQKAEYWYQKAVDNGRKIDERILEDLRSQK